MEAPGMGPRTAVAAAPVFAILSLRREDIGTHDNDAIANCSTEKSERLYLRHIEIATAIISSETIMFSLPMIYVGSLTGC
ncbi:hypothetical protein IEQ34_005887 [Dendrobium chrysotoxum]|uniref:Uncharacterized protein n=1 Tax=Dendrobium chrysotoxum TaxID=161865 RepID=A0AAV7HDF6_DENCH|nr:hypothetical protein IEQ34_005887 [Dendrobium chrysotoxum]